jgi:hypothetical protein
VFRVWNARYSVDSCPWIELKPDQEHKYLVQVVLFRREENEMEHEQLPGADASHQEHVSAYSLHETVFRSAFGSVERRLVRDFENLDRHVPRVGKARAELVGPIRELSREFYEASSKNENLSRDLRVFAEAIRDLSLALIQEEISKGAATRRAVSDVSWDGQQLSKIFRGTQKSMKTHRWGYVKRSIKTLRESLRDTSLTPKLAQLVGRVVSFKARSELLDAAGEAVVGFNLLRWDRDQTDERAAFSLRDLDQALGRGEGGTLAYKLAKRLEYEGYNVRSVKTVLHHAKKFSACPDAFIRKSKVQRASSDEMIKGGADLP